jgi:hypothetical protein
MQALLVALLLCERGFDIFMRFADIVIDSTQFDVVAFRLVVHRSAALKKAPVCQMWSAPGVTLPPQ